MAWNYSPYVYTANAKSFCYFVATVLLNCGINLSSNIMLPDRHPFLMIKTVAPKIEHHVKEKLQEIIAIIQQPMTIIFS